VGISGLKRWSPFILVSLCAGLGSACTHHAVLPPTPAPSTPVESSISEQTWKLAPLTFKGRTGKDKPSDIQALEDRFKDYLKARVALGQETQNPDLIFKLELKAVRNHYRTVILDLINAPFAPLIIGGFFNPEWGRAKVSGALTVYNRDQEHIGHYLAFAEQDFSMFIYSWYRHQPIEDSFRASYASVFEGLLKKLNQDNLTLVTSRPTRASQGGLDDFFEDPLLIDSLLQDPGAMRIKTGQKKTKSSPPALQLSQDTKPVFVLYEEPEATKPIEDKDRARIIYERQPVVYSNRLLKGLAALGGFEGAYFTGEATVTSSIKQEDGSKVEVANGRALHRGYRITLFDAPETTGFYWYPVIGFLDQSIDITDFYEEVPTIGTSIGTDIDADCTIIEDGVVTEIPCGLPNTYNLHMQSIVAGLRMGFSFVAGTPYAQFFFSGTAGSNLMEWRSITAALGGRDQGQREQVEFMQSAAFGSTIGLVFPKLHLSIRGMFNYEVYQSFEFDQPIEFMGPTVCDFSIGRCERQRAFVESTSLSSWTMQFAAGVVF